MTQKQATVKIVRKHFAQLGSDGCVEEKNSKDKVVATALQKASAEVPGTLGKPDFIVRFKNNSELAILVECREQNGDHGTGPKDDPTNSAIAAAVRNAEHLAKSHHVLAVAVSGKNKNALKVSHFFNLKNFQEAEPFLSNTLLPPKKYLSNMEDLLLNRQREDSRILAGRLADLNNDLRAKRVPESERAILVTLILIALRNAQFHAYLKKHSQKSPKKLVDHLVKCALTELKNEGLHKPKLDILRGEFSFLKTSPVLSKAKSVLHDIIEKKCAKISLPSSIPQSIGVTWVSNTPNCYAKPTSTKASALF